MPLPIGLVDPLAQLRVELLHRLASGPFAQEGEGRVDEAGKAAGDHPEAEARRHSEMLGIALAHLVRVLGEGIFGHGGPLSRAGPSRQRSEERRVGKECRSRGAPEHEKKEEKRESRTETRVDKRENS